MRQLSTLEFADTAQNAVLIGGPGTGKTHLATAIGVAGITAKDKRVRFYSTVDLVNELEKEKREGKAGRLALALMRHDGGDRAMAQVLNCVASHGLEAVLVAVELVIES